LSKYAYHGTTIYSIFDGVGEVGLRPQSGLSFGDKNGFDIDDESLFVFFTKSFETASLWGNIVLRFPWPDNFYKDYVGNADLEQGDDVNWFTRDSIKLEDIEVLLNNIWSSLGQNLEQLDRDFPKYEDYDIGDL
jgi:hypothetical protein